MTTSPNSLRSTSNLANVLGIAALLGSFAPAAVLLCLGQPAAAQSTPQSRPAEVRIDVSAKTAEAVGREVAIAARRLCDDVIVHSPLQPRELSNCQKEAEARGMAQVAPRPSLLAARD